MPIHEYECKYCGNVFEELVPTGKRKHTCPECGRDAKKIMSNPHFILKGNMWSHDGYTRSFTKDEKAGRVRDE